MKALVWHGRQDLCYEDVPEPTPSLGQAKVKVHFCGICGSDLHEYRSGPVFLSREPNPITGKSVPLILGHEFSGKVVEVGEGVSALKPGDRVTGDCIWSCGKCYYCTRNRPNLCPQGAYTGFQADGAMAEYMVAPDYTLYKLPDSVSDEIGALVEPLEVGFHTIRRSRLQIGDTVAIVGAGTIGICVFWAAKAAGASKIFVLEISKVRRDRVSALGASEAINPNEVNAVKAIHEFTDGMGVDISIDCVGLPNTAPLTVELARRGGTTVLVGMYPTPIPDFDLFHVLSTEKVILGSWAYAREAPLIIDLLARGQIDPSRLITAKVALRDGVEKGFKELISNPEKHLKILLQP